MVIIDPTGMRTVSPFVKREPARCVHELTSLSRSDSRTFGGDIYPLRLKLGQMLAKVAPCPERTLWFRCQVMVRRLPSAIPRSRGYLFEKGYCGHRTVDEDYLEPARGVANFGADALECCTITGVRQAARSRGGQPCHGTRGQKGDCLTS